METRDVSSDALVTPESFPVEFTRFFFFSSAQYELCTFVRHSAELCGRCCSAQCIVQELFGTSGARCFRFLATVHLVHKTVSSRLETLHAPWLKKTSCLHLIPRLVMEARLVVLEKRLKRTEEVLVMERLAQRFAGSAQQMVGT